MELVAFTTYDRPAALPGRDCGARVCLLFWKKKEKQIKPDARTCICFNLRGSEWIGIELSLISFQFILIHVDWNNYTDIKPGLKWIASPRICKLTGHKLIHVCKKVQCKRQKAMHAWRGANAQNNRPLYSQLQHNQTNGRWIWLMTASATSFFVFFRESSSCFWVVYIKRSCTAHVQYRHCYC